MNVHCINIVHVDGLFINMSEEKSKSKNGKVLRIIKVETKDQTGFMTVTLFGDLIGKVKGENRYLMTYLTVGKYGIAR